MFKNKRIIALVLALATLIGVAAMFAGCSQVKLKDVERDPNGEVKAALTQTYEALKSSASGSPLTYMIKTFQEGAFTLKYGDEETTAFTNTMYFDADNSTFADTFIMESADEKTELSLYLSGANAALKLPAQAGGKTIGMNLQTAMDDLKDADAFWNITGMTYETFEAEFGPVIEGLSKAKDDSSLVELLKLKSALDKAKKIIGDCDVDVEERKIVTGSDEVKAINVTYTMTTKELNELIDVFAEWFGDNWEAAITELIGQLPIDAVVGDSFTSELMSAVNEIKATMEETSANVKLTFSINPSNGLLMKAECIFETTVNNENEYITVNVDLGKDLNKSREYQLNYIVSSGIESAASKVTIGYQKLDSDGMYSRRLYCTAKGEGLDKTMEFLFKWNTTSEVFTAEFDSVDTNVVLSGEAGVKGDGFWVVADEISVNREKTQLGIRLEFDPGAKSPKMPAYTNIADLSEDDWTEILLLISGN